MKNRAIIVVGMLICLGIAAGCAASTAVEFNTPAPQTDGATPAPDNGQITLPGVNIQVYAPGPNAMLNTPDAHGRIAGVWLGLWHGIISPVTLLLSFLGRNAYMYEVHNDGFRYDLGFFLGVVLFPAVLGLLVGRR